MNKRALIFLGILLVAGFATRFIFFGHPAQVVFDETHYGKYISYYLMGNYFFDVHPPLAKLLIALVGALGGYKPGYMFLKISDAYPDHSYIILRLLPMFIGSLIPALIYLFARELKLRDESAFVAGLLIAFENSLTVESRFILINIFLVFFGFLGLLVYFIYRRKRNFLLFILSLILLACALSVKWTGLSFLGLAGLIELYDLYRTKEKIIDWVSSGVLFIVIPLIVYVSLFAVHFYLLPKSGTGDGFMSPSVQKTLFANAYDYDDTVKPANFVEKFANLHDAMYKVNYQPALAHHPYESAWYTWPLELRPIYYWWDLSAQEKIYSLGNPVAYWLGTLAMVITAVLLFFKKFRKKYGVVAVFLIIAYCANWLPFIFIHRSLFTYHYFTSLIFSCIAIAFLLDCIKSTKWRRVGEVTIVALALGFFIYFAPLTYGLPLSDASFNAHMWFKSWR